MNRFWSPPGIQMSVADSIARRAASRSSKLTFLTSLAPAFFHVSTELSPASGSAEDCGNTTTTAFRPPASSSVRATMASFVSPPPTATSAPSAAAATGDPLVSR